MEPAGGLSSTQNCVYELLHGFHGTGIANSQFIGDPIWSDDHVLKLQPGEFVLVPDNQALKPNYTSVTAWTKFSSFNAGLQNPIVCKGSLTNGSYFLTVFNGKLRFYINQGSWVFAESNITVGAGLWHHFAGTYDGTTIKVYINGILKGSTAASGTITQTTDGFTIGRGRTGGLEIRFGDPSDATFRDVRLYNSAISDSVIWQMCHPPTTYSLFLNRRTVEFGKSFPLPADDCSFINKTGCCNCCPTPICNKIRYQIFLCKD
jgi:hypothetical protein